MCPPFLSGPVDKDVALAKGPVARSLAGLAYDSQVQSNLLNQFNTEPPYQGKIYAVTATNSIPSTYYAANALLNK